ncbi:hypothetical protein O181_113184 [Austropuccinia psidii MF-1]|uniref:SNF2 N-terminal domain-containing protein n=1 Tax=Austropuccinia psidii MF-1 TaxID=1389203 RepID=A0A9Q3PTF3_9BASI|nr:hypothetical protein [Austropuccinia psidii MF-1]
MDNPPVTFGPTSPPGSTFNSRHIITNKVVSSFQSLLNNTCLYGLLADDMVLGKTIQAIALIDTSKEQLIVKPHHSMPTLLNHQPAIRNIQEFSHWSTASQHLHGPASHSLSKAEILPCDIFITSYNTIC